MGKFKLYLTEINRSNIKYNVEFLEKLVNKSITIKKLVSLLNKNNKIEDILFYSIKENGDSLGKNGISIFGSYADDIDQETDSEEANVLIYIVYNDEEIILTDAIFQFLQKEIERAVNHEFIHQQQARARWFEFQKVYYAKDHPKAYLSNDDEIEAYANDIALDILEVYPDEKDALNFLKTVNANNSEFSTYLSQYYALFDNNHIVMKKLFKKVYQYIIDKP